MTITLPLRTDTESNAKGHWRAKARRAAEQRHAAYQLTPLVDLPCTITLTRIAPGMLDDDNLPSALKHIRDGIADKLVGKARLFRRAWRVIGDDRDLRLTWVYAQRRGGRGEYAVEITLEPRQAHTGTFQIPAGATNGDEPEDNSHAR